MDFAFLGGDEAFCRDAGLHSTREDITERKEMEEKLRVMAHHDALTGLADRAMYDAKRGGRNRYEIDRSPMA